MPITPHTLAGSHVETDLVIGFGLREIVPPRDIEERRAPILNIHISYLPCHRGAHPNFWSWYDETPVGVTIHRIDTGLDTGPVVLQKLVNIDDSKTTFRESHQILISEAESLFLDNLDSLVEGNWGETPRKLAGHIIKKATSRQAFWAGTESSKRKSRELKHGETRCLQLQIDGVTIGKNTRPYLIAEVSANHNGSIEKAKDCITAAAQAGASAVKIQTYTADTMTIDSKNDDFLIRKASGKAGTLYETIRRGPYAPFEWHAELFKHAAEQEITLFSSPFDETAVDLLESLNTPAYKVASFETDRPTPNQLHREHRETDPDVDRHAQLQRREIRRAVDTATQNGCEA